MLCVAAVSALVLHAAVLLLPLPASAMALQPLIEFAPSLKLTLPVGLLPAMVAVNVTLVPTVDGFFELTSVVVVGAGPTELTIWDSAALVEAAVMLCVAAVSALVLHAAVLLLPLPASAMALQPLIEFAPSLKLTLPVGLLPALVAVNVPLVPTVEAALPASPAYAAVMLCVAAVSALVLQEAVLLLPLPASAMALQPLIEFAPSLKLTLPV